MRQQFPDHADNQENSRTPTLTGGGAWVVLHNGVDSGINGLRNLLLFGRGLFSSRVRCRGLRGIFFHRGCNDIKGDKRASEGQIGFRSSVTSGRGSCVTALLATKCLSCKYTKRNGVGVCTPSIAANEYGFYVDWVPNWVGNSQIGSISRGEN